MGKNKKQKVNKLSTVKASIFLFFALLIVVFIIVFLKVYKVSDDEKTKDISKNETVVEYTKGTLYGTDKVLEKEDINKIFIEDYDMIGLVDHRVFIDENIFQISFYFDDQVTTQGIDKAKDFLTYYIDGLGNPIVDERVPYADLAKRRGYDSLITKIYYEEFMVYQKNLLPLEKNDQKRKILFFEDANVFLPFREVKTNELLNEFGDFILESVNSSEITFEKSINKHVLIVNIQTNNFAKSSTISQIKGFIDQNLIDLLRTPEGYRIYAGVLIRLRFSNKIYHEEYYVNTSEDQNWYDVKQHDWNNHQFVVIHENMG